MSNSNLNIKSRTEFTTKKIAEIISVLAKYSNKDSFNSKEVLKITEQTIINLLSQTNKTELFSLSLENMPITLPFYHSYEEAKSYYATLAISNGLEIDFFLDTVNSILCYVYEKDRVPLSSLVSRYLKDNHISEPGEVSEEGGQFLLVFIYVLCGFGLLTLDTPYSTDIMVCNRYEHTPFVSDCLYTQFNNEDFKLLLNCKKYSVPLLTKPSLVSYNSSSYKDEYQSFKLITHLKEPRDWTDNDVINILNNVKYKISRSGAYYHQLLSEFRLDQMTNDLLTCKSLVSKGLCFVDPHGDRLIFNMLSLVELKSKDINEYNFVVSFVKRFKCEDLNRKINDIETTILIEKSYINQRQSVVDFYSNPMVTELAEESSFYIPFFRDSRGRFYPKSFILNTQGSSISKSLITLSETERCSLSKEDQEHIDSISSEDLDSIQEFLAKTETF